MEDREINRGIREPDRSEEPTVELGNALVARPVEEWQRQPIGPDDHERVPLEQLAQATNQGLVAIGGARRATARRVADSQSGIRGSIAEEHELGRQPRRLAAGERAALDPGDPGIAVS